MRIRLQVIVSRNQSFDVESSDTPVVIGRDPHCEVPLEGDSSRGVSWHHAQIDLLADRAYLSDLGSTNGTFLNDERVSGRAPLRKGNYLRLGQNGPTLRIAEIDLRGAPKELTAIPEAVHPPRSAHPVAEAAPIHAVKPAALLDPPGEDSPTFSFPTGGKRLALVVFALVGPLLLIVVAGLAFFGGGEPPPTTAPPVEQPWLCLRCRGSKHERVNCSKCQGKGYFPCRYRERWQPALGTGSAAGPGEFPDGNGDRWRLPVLHCQGGTLVERSGRGWGDCPHCLAPQGVPCPKCQGVGTVVIPCRLCQPKEGNP